MSDCSVFLAQTVGLFYLLISLSMLCRQAWWKKALIELIQSPATMALSGVLFSALGLLVVLTHNLWVADWRAIVTLFGWYMLAQGALRLFYPEAFAKVKKTMLEDGKFVALNWVLLIGSIYLIWNGFFRY